MRPMPTPKRRSSTSSSPICATRPSPGLPVAQLRAVIAEDEGNLHEQLRETLAAVWPELEVWAEAEDGVAARRALEDHSPDILFLDIQMPGMNGLEVAKQASGRCHVVFVTAYDKY